MTESVATNFPKAELTALAPDVLPTLATLKLLHSELNDNAMSIHSDRGDGIQGHLVLTISPAAYLAVAGVPFVAPVHPGVAPVHNAGATAAQITETNRQHAADLKEFQVYTAVQAALKRQLLAAVPNSYINDLRSEAYNYARVTVLQLLEHLDTSYGVVTAHELQQNLHDLQRQWTSAQPLADLWKQIRTCQAFAEDFAPITDEYAVLVATENLEKTGLFTDALKDWHKRDLADQTLAQLKVDFNKAEKERKRQLTSRSAGYLATDVAHAATQSAATANPPVYYCWSHGITNDPAHTGRTCPNKHASHVANATFTNMQGGLNSIRRSTGERIILNAKRQEIRPRPGPGRG